MSGPLQYPNEIYVWAHPDEALAIRGWEKYPESSCDQKYIHYLEHEDQLRTKDAEIATLKAEVERLTKERYQSRVREWLLACFGAEIASDVVERNFRFLEESLELVQSLGCSKGEAMSLVNYVYERPVGEPYQEAGGVMVTLACLCGSNGLDMDLCGETELARIWTKVEAIRAKQAAKPRMITGGDIKARGEV